MVHADSGDVPLTTDPYVPAVHWVHSVDDPADHSPAAHISLTDEFVQYDPAAHSLADDDPAGQYSPRVHTLGSLAPSAQ